MGETCRDKVPVVALVQCLGPQPPAEGFPASGSPSGDGEHPTFWNGQPAWWQQRGRGQRGQGKEPGAVAASRHQPCRAQRPRATSRGAGALSVAGALFPAPSWLQEREKPVCSTVIKN